MQGRNCRPDPTVRRTAPLLRMLTTLSPYRRGPLRDRVRAWEITPIRLVVPLCVAGLAGNDAPNAPGGIERIAASTRDEMDVGVRDRLSGDLA